MRTVTYLLAMIMVGVLFIGIHDSYATATYKNALFGATSTHSAAGQNMAKMNVQIVSPQSFGTVSNEDHNWHIQFTDSGNVLHKVGYFVNKANPSTPKFFDEEWFGPRVHNYEGMTSVGPNGSYQDFIIRRESPNWDYYLNAALQDFSSYSSATTYNLSSGIAIAEQVCWVSPYCTSSTNRGSMPIVDMKHAFQYQNSISYPPVFWNDLDSAKAYYQYIDPTGASFGGSIAQTALCQPMSMAGRQQIGTLSSDEMKTGDNVVGTCTTIDFGLWP